MNNFENAEQQIQIDITQLKSLRCEFCNGILFSETSIIKELPALVSPTGQNQHVRVPLLACDSCGKLTKESQMKAKVLTQVDLENDTKSEPTTDNLKGLEEQPKSNIIHMPGSIKE